MVLGVAASCVLVLFSESCGHRMRICVTQTALNLKHITDNGHCHRVSADGTTSAAGCKICGVRTRCAHGENAIPDEFVASAIWSQTFETSHCSGTFLVPKLPRNANLRGTLLRTTPCNNVLIQFEKVLEWLPRSSDLRPWNATCT